MEMNGPDRATLRAAVSLAVRAPSIHNSQPWRWRLGARSLHLHADASRWLPATDPGERDLMVSCGAALHHLQVALAALGWTAEIHRVPNLDYPRHLATIELGRHEPSQAELEAVTAINHRRADRRRYADWPLPAGPVDQLATRAATSGVLLTPATEPWMRRRLVEAIEEADRRQRDRDTYTSELTYWSGRTAIAVDGVPRLNTSDGPRYGDLTLRSFDGTPSGGFAHGAGELLVLGTASDDPVSRLRAGEAASSVMLAATSAGLASCPLSQPLEIGQTRSLVTDVIGGAVPQLLLRVGWPPVADHPLPQTPRRPVDSVIETPGALQA